MLNATIAEARGLLICITIILVGRLERRNDFIGRREDSTILDFIEKLKLIFNFNQLQIVDYWDADLCAIGFKKGNKLVYVSTYNHTQKETIRYDYDLDFIDELNDDESITLEVGREVSEDIIINKIRIYLED